MKDYSRAVRKLIKRIPDDFECAPGCTACCALHAWTWSEWNKLPQEKRKHAVNKMAPCPFITKEGCECYEFRPLICRLWGYAGEIGAYGPYSSVSLACKRGIEPKTRLSRKEARDIFLTAMTILKMEWQDTMNAGLGPLFAGPYGRWVGERKEFNP